MKNPADPDALRRFLTDLEREALERIDELGGTSGAVTIAQRPWSAVLDQVAAEREAA